LNRENGMMVSLISEGPKVVMYFLLRMSNGIFNHKFFWKNKPKTRLLFMLSRQVNLDLPSYCGKIHEVFLVCLLR